MRVFSDEDTNHIFSNRSSMEHIQNVTTNNVSLIFNLKLLKLVYKLLKLLDELKMVSTIYSDIY